MHIDIDLARVVSEARERFDEFPNLHQLDYQICHRLDHHLSEHRFHALRRITRAFASGAKDTGFYVQEEPTHLAIILSDVITDGGNRGVRTVADLALCDLAKDPDELVGVRREDLEALLTLADEAAGSSESEQYWEWHDAIRAVRAYLNGERPEQAV